MSSDEKKEVECRISNLYPEECTGKLKQIQDREDNAKLSIEHFAEACGKKIIIFWIGNYSFLELSVIIFHLGLQTQNDDIETDPENCDCIDGELEFYGKMALTFKYVNFF